MLSVYREINLKFSFEICNFKFSVNRFNKF